MDERARHEADLERREAALAAREADHAQRMEDADEIVAHAAERGAAADARDLAADRREQALDLAELLAREGHHAYGDDLPHRRNAALDRMSAKDDRASHEDLVALTEAHDDNA
ncbi:hypothetical protein [Nocardioides rubriscoriae]|uniref:hypothetical protein n=1 Tax=Nocardioides rubriscoriae TaxID=642762 RepID=UPI0011DFCC9A|nr:hypothetical protein [Nocardioides rubriscoriae]